MSTTATYPTAVKTYRYADAMADAQALATQFGVAYLVFSWPEKGLFTAANEGLFSAEDFELFSLMESVVARVEPETEMVRARIVVGANGIARPVRM